MLPSSPLLLALLAAPLASASCLHATSLLPRALSASGTEVKVSDFSYTGLTAPLNWASISPENLDCSTGTVQSPINIDDTIAVASAAPRLDIASVEAAEFENLGTTVEVIVNGTTNVGGADFSLQQFHFHSPSEHRINEEYFPLEMHMVHEAADGSGGIAVVAVLFEISASEETQLLKAVTENIEQIAQPGTVAETGALDFAALIQHVQTTPLRQYTGSLTTPPCKEGLTFLVTEQPLPVDVETFNKIKKTVKFNSRYTQNSLGETNLLHVGCSTAQSLGVEFGGGVVGGGNATLGAGNQTLVNNGGVQNVTAPPALKAPAPVNENVGKEEAAVKEPAAAVGGKKKVVCLMGACHESSA